MRSRFKLQRAMTNLREFTLLHGLGLLRYLVIQLVPVSDSQLFLSPTAQSAKPPAFYLLTAPTRLTSFVGPGPPVQSPLAVGPLQ